MKPEMSIRRLRKQHNSLLICVPRRYARALSWQEFDWCSIERLGEGVYIEKISAGTKRKSNLAKIKYRQGKLYEAD